MSPYLALPFVALVASGLTLFSGFGLGTLLMPAFALFFPLEMAVAMTAVVHLANNLFKLALLGRYTDRHALLRFGLSAIAGALLGAALLVLLSGLPVLHRYEWAGRPHEITGVKLVIALLMLGFAWAEMDGRLERRAWPARVMPLGGLLSGFFGGLSGHQGALRSAFLSRAGLGKEAFLGTGVALACLVDVTRLGVYGTHIHTALSGAPWDLIALAVGAAFLGAFLGTRLVAKVTLRFVQRMVAAMLALLALALASGLA